MPEIATAPGYRIPKLAYRPPETPSFVAPQIVPDLQGAAAYKGSAAAMGLVAETLAKLPDIITKGIQAGRAESQQKAVHNLKMGALAGQVSPARLRALEGFSFGADDSLSYKPEDPFLQALKYEEAKENIAYKRALGKRALAGPARKPTLYETVTGTGGTSGGVVSDESTPAGDVLPPVTSDELPLPVPETPTLPRNQAELDAFSGHAGPQAPLGSEPVLGADVPVGIPIAKPARGALATFGAGPSTAPIAEPAATATPQPTAAPPAKETPQNGQYWSGNPGDPVLLYKDGKVTHQILPGGNRWEQVRPPTPTAAQNAEATELIKRGFTVAQIGGMTDDQKQAALKEPVKETVGGFDFDSVEAAKKFAEEGNFESPEVTKRGDKFHVKEFKPKEVDVRGKSKLTDSTKKELASSANLVGDLADLESTQEKLYNENKSGPIMGRWEAFKTQMGMGDPEYVQTSGAIDVGKFKIARLLNGPGVLTDRDISRAQAVAPTLNETPASFKAKMSNVRRMLRESVETWKTINASQSSPDVVALADRVIAELGGNPTATTSAAVTAPTGRAPEGGFLVGRRYKGEDGTIKIYLGGPVGDAASWR